MTVRAWKKFSSQNDEAPLAIRLTLTFRPGTAIGQRQKGSLSIDPGLKRLCSRPHEIRLHGDKPKLGAAPASDHLRSFTQDAITVR
ncbi:hypothetical protein D3C76_820140 [compost metagenome]